MSDTDLLQATPEWAEQKTDLSKLEEVKVPDIAEAVKPVQEPMKPKVYFGGNAKLTYGDVEISFAQPMMFLDTQMRDLYSHYVPEEGEPPIPCPICGALWCMAPEAIEARIIAARIRKFGR